jgi:hypothetical protein
MKIISLDQNAISNLVKKADDPFWRDLREALLAGVKTGKLLCPIPKETIAETIPCSRDVRIRMRDLQQELSQGFSFKPFEVIEGQETLALVRSGVDTCRYERIVWHTVENDALAQAKTHEMRDAQDLMRRRMQAFIPPPDQDKLSLRDTRCRVVTSRAGSIYRQIERLLAGQPLDPSDDLEFGPCQFLISHAVTQAELGQLRDEILTHRWEAIPLVFYAAALGALMDDGRIRGRKYSPNDETDISRVSIALRCSAMLITEKSMAHLVKLLGREKGEHFDVFATRDHAAIRTHLGMAIEG